jgi:hypothetical protein
MVTMFIDQGNDNYGMVVAPANNGLPTYHDASLAGYLTSAIADSAGSAEYSTADARPIGPVSDNPYPMASVEDLIAAEKELNPGRVVVGQATHDAVEGDPATEDYTITVDTDVSPEVYLDCYGPKNVTVTLGTYSVVNPCLGGGTFIGTLNDMGAGDEATITATHDTTWRVVLYTMEQSPGDTPPPIAEPAQP